MPSREALLRGLFGYLDLLHSDRYQTEKKTYDADLLVPSWEPGYVVLTKQDIFTTLLDEHGSMIMIIHEAKFNTSRYPFVYI